MTLTPNYAIATPNVYTPIPAQATIGASLSAISTALQMGGWILTGTLSNGYRFLGTSPQGYSVLLDLTYQTTGISSVPNTIQWQLHSAVLTGSAATPGWSLWDSSSVYQIVAFPCGWFFSRPGSNVDATCGGIPYCPFGALVGVPPSPPAECNQGSVIPSELYWSMAQKGAIGGSVKDPRSSIDLNYGGAATGPAGLPSTSGVMTGAVTTSGGGIGDPQILRMSSTNVESGVSTSDDGQPVWMSGADIAYPAFIAWGPTNSSRPTIRGQLYNAINRGGMYPADQTKTFDGYTWQAYTNAYFFGTLFALRGGAGGAGNWGWSVQ
ncbi:MAG: hypothetical protein WA741_20470 [Candidatus Sulfotelmatobacter sp.]